MALTSNYLGLSLDNPLVVSASPISRDPELALRLEDAGASAIVMRSLFAESLEEEERAIGQLLEQGLGHAEASSYLPGHYHHATGGEAERYLEELARLKQRLSMPVIASLNGIHGGDWLAFARELEQAGADALELNVYYIATDIEEGADAVEQHYVDLLRALRAVVKLPIAMKLAPYFSSLGHLVKRLEAAGADGVVLFNRFFQPEIDLDTLKAQPRLHPSGPDETLLAGRWLALLYRRVGLSLAASGGVRNATAALQLLLSGADVVQIYSSIREQGPKALRTILDDIRAWLDESPYDSLEQLRGSLSYYHSTEPGLYGRADYVAMMERLNRSPGGL